jgi:hypothetical protein
MPSFSSEVYDSTKEKPTEEQLSPYTDYLQRRAKAAQQWEGSGTAPTPTTSIADQLAAEKGYRSGEYGRREKAATQQMGLAKAEDTRQGTVADRVRQALYNRENIQDKLETQQSQSQRTFGQGMEEMQQQAGQTIAKQDFSAYQNAGDRYDSLMAAYDKGTAEMGMLDAAKGNALKMADLDAYFARVGNDMDNAFKDWQATAQFDATQALSQLNSQASGIAAMIDGIMKIGGGVGYETMESTYFGGTPVWNG